MDVGPREVPVTLTVTSVTPPPGFATDPAFGTVGEVRARTWTITGPCDGEGPCEVQHCRAPGDCTLTFAMQPAAGGYTATATYPVQWAAPECSGGEISTAIEFTPTGTPDSFAMTGTWTESTAQQLLTGSDGRECGIYLLTSSMTSP